MTAALSAARKSFHDKLVGRHTLTLSQDQVASNADKGQKSSVAIAREIAFDLKAQTVPVKLQGQRAGKQFEEAVESFLEEAFPLFHFLRPGDWTIQNVGGSRKEYQVAKYEPYTHLEKLANAIKDDGALAAVLGNSYEISPDILIARNPVPDSVINRTRKLVDGNFGRNTVIRSANQRRPIIHAIVSCKWTLRSDRAQNARSEALNIIRNRKGRMPHTVVVTGDPSPSRLASLALGTGEIDMVYHFALPELIRAVGATGSNEAISLLDTLVIGNRIRDITDLPLDLVV